MSKTRVKYGEVHPPKTMFLRQEVGKITDDDGNSYEATLNMGGQQPIIHSKQTNKWFTLSWGDIVSLAIDAGIDTE